MAPGQLYTTFRLGGRDVGAAYTMRDAERTSGAAPYWLIYVAVDDADAIANRVPALGGTVLMPVVDVEGFGRMAVLQDPTGAAFAIWQAGTHGGTGFTTRHDHTICWADLSTPDQDRAANFYTELFGWQMVAGSDLTPASPGDYFHVACGRQLIGGIAPATQHDPKASSHWLIYIAVPDCREMEERIVALGGRVLTSTFPIGADGFAAVVTDPQGAAFGIHQE